MRALAGGCGSMNGRQDLLRLEIVLALEIPVRRHEEIFEQNCGVAPSALVSSTVAPSATSAVAAVEGWTIAQSRLSKIAWYWFSPEIAKQ